MKAYDETIGELVTLSVRVPMAIEVSLLNLVKTFALCLIILSRPIFWMTDSYRMLIELLLFTMILSTTMWASCTELTMASSWGKSTSAASCSMKSTIGPSTTFMA
ncbi:hypothetical protein PS1_012544 [Malus domestica]